jgi:hypothetical protein
MSKLYNKMKGGKMKLITYKGENLKMIKFLLGGIGTGSISFEAGAY